MSVGPENLVGGVTLQTIIHAQIPLLAAGVQVTVCLRPGTYTLDEPIHITAAHSTVNPGSKEGGLTIEDGQRGAKLQAPQDTTEPFLHGTGRSTSSSSRSLSPPSPCPHAQARRWFQPQAPVPARAGAPVLPLSGG